MRAAHPAPASVRSLGPCSMAGTNKNLVYAYSDCAGCARLQVFLQPAPTSTAALARAQRRSTQFRSCMAFTRRSAMETSPARSDMRGS
mmetsp:Transcript_47352/g.146606  ORF Transcript_47352/g.146606 Transcript_47352/m.146606 type:complete len:88 (+) Transcript_47352:43-306(+)